MNFVRIGRASRSGGVLLDFRGALVMLLGLVFLGHRRRRHIRDRGGFSRRNFGENRLHLRGGFFVVARHGLFVLHHFVGLGVLVKFFSDRRVCHGRGLGRRGNGAGSQRTREAGTARRAVLVFCERFARENDGLVVRG